MSPVEVNDTLRSSDQPIKRAPVVYGRRSNQPLPPSTVPLEDDLQQSSECSRVHRIFTVSSQRRQSSSSSSVHTSDCECSHISGAASCFQFGFRHRLKELDEEFDDHDAQSSRLSPSSSREVAHAGPSQVKDLQSISMGTATHSSEARRSSGDLPFSLLSPSPARLHATSAPVLTPGSPLVRRRTRRAQNPVLSDSEAEEPRNSSSVSPVQHAITTPHSRSSPTPPTSSEILMVDRKTKGKTPARNVLPLLFDSERSLSGQFSTKSKKRRRSEPSVRSKTKAPTRKERREAALESSRIAANRPVEVIRTQEQKHSLSMFFAGLRQDNIVTTTSGAELPSDPIEKFSSPTENPTRMALPNSMFGAPTRLLRNPGHIGTSKQASFSQSTKALPPAATNSDDEMPSVTSILQKKNRGNQKLLAMKQVALQHANISETLDINSEDDDLLIVKDDMHAVAREEAAYRRLDNAHSSPIKDVTTLRRINHPSIRPAVVSPRKLSKQELQELARPSFARIRKGFRGQLTKTQLDQLMIMQHTEEQLKSIKQHEDEWVKGGGRLSRDISGDGPQTSLSQKLEVYAKLGLKVAETGGTAEEGASADESDEDYTLDLRSSASPLSAEADEDDGEPENSMEVSQVPHPQVDDSEEEEVVAPLRRNKSGQRHPRVVVGSDDEGEQSAHHNLPSVQRDSASSMESQTDDENDKENSAKLMYDRSENKENKAVVRHELSPSELAFGSRLGSLHSVEDAGCGLSLASVTDLNDASSPNGDVIRSPLKDISADEHDLLSSTPPASFPFTEGLLRSAAISPPHPSKSTLSPGSSQVLRSQRINQLNHLSLDSENNENNPSGFKPKQPSFLERLRSQVSPEPPLTSVNPVLNDGFSQLFSAEDQSVMKPVDKAGNDGLALTLDIGLKPALAVSGTLRRKAETIFEKEQEYVVAAAVRQNNEPKELLYVNDHGFLTQTRPESSSPQVYRMTPSQASKFIGTQVHSTQTQLLSVRPPLRTLSLAVSQELSPEPQPPRRLRKRSPSPLEHKHRGNSTPVATLNVFDILGKVPKLPSKTEKEEHGKSEFVAVEAEESDEDDMFGFGGPKKDDEEGDENEQDKVVEGLVDDTVMDAETEAADLVLEKHREHEEEDDQRLQKLHQDAIEGKFRLKRRDRGVGLEEDSDEDDDEDAHRIRQRIHKKRKIEGDSLEALGQNEETRAFYNTYHQDLIDEDNEFGHFREDIAGLADEGDASVPVSMEQDIVTIDEIRQRVREMAQNDLVGADHYSLDASQPAAQGVEVLDPEDTSWIDQSMTTEAEDAVRVKVVGYQQNKTTARPPRDGRSDFDVERPDRHVENERERKQMTSWAKNQSYQYRGTGRSGNSAAITGHTKVKAGSGSLRPAQSSAAALSRVAKAKTSDLLSTMLDRSSKFA